MNARIFQAICIAGAGVIAVSGTTTMLSGCAGLDYSARGEGTGIQVVGALVVLAKYKASERQKSVAEARARKDYARAARPVYQQRRAKVQAEAGKRIAAVKQDYAKKIEVAKASGVIGASPSAPPVVLQKQAGSEILRIEEEAAAETAALDQAYQSLGGQPEQTAPRPVARSTRPIPGTEELARSLAPQGPQFIAVPVPAQNVAEEKRGKATYMLWDTHRQRLASDDVLVMNREARAGSTVKIDGVSARVADGGQ